MTDVQVSLGLEPKFPSTTLFDESAVFVLDHIKHELWPSYVDSPSYRSTRSKVVSALECASKVKAEPILMVRTANQNRYAMHLVKKVVVIGNAVDCDIVIKVCAPLLRFCTSVRVPILR